VIVFSLFLTQCAGVYGFLLSHWLVFISYATRQRISVCVCVQVASVQRRFASCFVLSFFLCDLVIFYAVGAFFALVVQNCYIARTDCV